MKTEQRKYLVWIGGSYNAFNTLDEATKEKQNYLNKGYTDIQIEIIKCQTFIKQLNNNPSLF
jgi:prefoldin subunit 5